ncbi:MAG: PilZ domain-containing protein [Planctomycetota bacterium]|jgi:hypothetical protein
MFIERRKNKRFQVQEDTMALLTPPGPHSTVVCDILDISTGGLALRFIAEQADSNEAAEIAIACIKPRFYLGRLPIKTVSAFAMSKDPSSRMVPRRLGVKFGQLTHDQMSELDAFIPSYAIGGCVDKSPDVQTAIAGW